MAQVGDLTKIIAGPVDVQLDNAGDGNFDSVGHLEDNVVVTYSPNQRDRTVMQYGTSPVGTIITGGNLKADLTIAEATKAHFDLLVPSGPYMGVDMPGTDLAASAPTLRIVSLSGTGEVIDLYKAVAGELPIPFDRGENDRVFKCTFKANLDPTKGPAAQGALGKANFPLGS